MYQGVDSSCPWAGIIVRFEFLLKRFVSLKFFYFDNKIFLMKKEKISL